MNPSVRKSRGFTIIELLMVMTTTGLLTALMTPAIQDARDAARRRGCKDNLKNIALALHNYHDVFTTFPPGWVMAYGDAASHPSYGWQSSLLPYLEQAPLYNKLDRNSPLESPNEMTSMAPEVFQCPSSPANDINELRGGFGNSNYSGNYGGIPIPRWTTGRMEAFWPGGGEVVWSGRDFAPQYGKPLADGSDASKGSDPASNVRRAKTQTGIFRWNSSVRMRDISDGTSNTLMVGERSMISGSSLWIGLQSNRYEDDGLTDASFWSPINSSVTGYSSEHAGGINVALCDGSVRFVADEIDSRPEKGVFQNIADIADNEVVPPTAFESEF